MADMALYRRPFSFFFFFVMLSLSGTIAGAGEITFTWRANPVVDQIVGYRLYYGATSRLTGGNYQYYIDFTSWQRCELGSDEPVCSPLGEDTVTCQGLFLDVPKCTISDLQGGLYFAMTAYNSLTESGFTQELYALIGTMPSSEKNIVLHQMFNLLLGKQ